MSNKIEEKKPNNTLTFNKITPQYIYLLKEREFLKTNEEIYKIGKTKQKNLDRFKQYPKSSILIFQILCEDCDNLERRLIKLFKKNYIHSNKIGAEYFQGDYKSMIKDIYRIVSEECNEAEKNKNRLIPLDIDDDFIEHNIIKTYEELIKAVPHITRIIIINKTDCLGFIRLKNNLDMLFSNKSKESLEEWLKNICSWLSTASGNFGIPYKNIYTFKYKNIIDDIIAKCYQIRPTYLSLKNDSEILVEIHNEYQILNIKTWAISKIDNFHKIIVWENLKKYVMNPPVERFKKEDYNDVFTEYTTNEMNVYEHLQLKRNTDFPVEFY